MFESPLVLDDTGRTVFAEINGAMLPVLEIKDGPCSAMLARAVTSVPAAITAAMALDDLIARAAGLDDATLRAELLALRDTADHAVMQLTSGG
jgi:hypothetical protein